MMRRGLWLFALACLAPVLASWSLAAQNDPMVVVFYSETCEDCERMMPVLTELQLQYPTVGFRLIEESDPDAPLMWQLSAAYGVVPSHFPVIFVGRTALVGASRTNELLVRSSVKACAASPCTSPLASLRATSFPWMTVLIVGLAALVLALLVLA